MEIGKGIDAVAIIVPRLIVELFLDQKNRWFC